jgi:anti-anti-sigma factor
VHWTNIGQRVVGDVVILDPRGQVTLADEEEAVLVRMVRRLLDDGRRRLLINLQYVSYVDSTGIGEIVGAFTRVDQAGGTLKLCGVSPRIRELLQATTLDAVIEAFTAEDEALRSFRS